MGIGSYSGRQELDGTGKIIVPGFLDAHIHLESSLVSPSEFARAVLPHGTTTVITDPHEIANVMGTAGIEYMLQATENLPVDVRFMLPSCVPATPMDESGANLDFHAIDSFYDHPRVQGLAEMMDFPGVIGADAQVVSKIVAAQAHHKKIDGHAPGLTGNDLNAYIAAGVYSDHECSTLDDALAKLERGQYIMIREGTAARNLDALLPLLTWQYADRCMFCCDDKHPNDLLERGHIDYIVRRAIGKGVDPIVAIKAACHNAARYFLLNNRGAIAPGYLADFMVIDDFEHFTIQGVDPIVAIKAACHNAARYFLLNNRGAIAPGYLADFMVIDDFEHFTIQQVYKKGVQMYDDGQVAAFSQPEIDPYLSKLARDTFHVPQLTAEDFRESRPRAVLGMVPGEIVTEDRGYAQGIDTERDILKIAVVERHKNTRHIGIGYLHGYGLKRGAVATSISHDSHNIQGIDTERDILKIAVVERHKNTRHIGIGYLHGYGLKRGAVATSISHDSHNIIAVGATEEDIALAVNRVIANRGGIVVVDEGRITGEVVLCVAGIMSDEPLEQVNARLEQAKQAAFQLGVTAGVDPFMTLSFMALPVIPTLRLTTRGVIDVGSQKYV